MPERFHCRVLHRGRTNLPIRCLTSGREICPPDKEIARTQSTLFGIEMVLRGHMTFHQNGRRHEVPPGAVYLLHRGGRHRYRAGRGAVCHKRFSTLGGPALATTLHSLDLGEVDVIRPREPERVRRLLIAIANTIRRGGPVVHPTLSRLAYDLLLTLGGDATPAWPPALTRALRHIEEGIDKPLQGPDLARVSGISLPQLTRLFRTHLGRAPHQHLQHLRLEQARVLLRITTLPVAAIARQCGYNDPLYFSKAFAKATGSPPSRYRQSEATAPEAPHDRFEARVLSDTEAPSFHTRFDRA